MQHYEFIPHNIHLKLCPNAGQIKNPTDAIVLCKTCYYFKIEKLIWNYFFTKIILELFVYYLFSTPAFPCHKHKSLDLQ